MTNTSFIGNIKRLGAAALLGAAIFAGVGSVQADAAQRYYHRSGYSGYRSGFAARAQQQGYADGVARGRYDRSIGVRRPNPAGHGAYQNGLNGWSREWGSAGTYQRYYRGAFMQGYRDGYAGRGYRR